MTTNDTRPTTADLEAARLILEATGRTGVVDPAIARPAEPATARLFEAALLVGGEALNRVVIGSTNSAPATRVETLDHQRAAALTAHWIGNGTTPDLPAYNGVVASIGDDRARLSGLIAALCELVLTCSPAAPEDLAPALRAAALNYAERQK